MAWPNRSLTFLKWSMSIMRTPERVVGPPAPGEQAAELVEVAPVRQAGQRVGRGARLGRPMRVGALERRRGLDRGPGQDPRGDPRPRLGGPARQDDGADDAGLGHERSGERVGQPVGLARRARPAGPRPGRPAPDRPRRRSCPGPRGRPRTRGRTRSRRGPATTGGGHRRPARAARRSAWRRSRARRAGGLPCERGPRPDRRCGARPTRPRSRHRPCRAAADADAPTAAATAIGTATRPAVRPGDPEPRSTLGRAGRQLEVGDRQDRRGARHAGPPADERRLEDARLGMEPDDDGMVGAGLDVELVDDRLDDRVGRHRAGQPLEDPGDALGLAAPADLAAAHGLAMEDRGEPAERHETGDQPVDGLARGRGRAGRRPGWPGRGRSRRGPTTSAGCDDPAVPCRASAGGGACHGLKDGGYGRSAPVCDGSTCGGRGSLSYYPPPAERPRRRTRRWSRQGDELAARPGRGVRTRPSVAPARACRPSAAPCPPAPFARYIAPSAAAMSSGPVRASSGNVAWPIDAATGTGPRVLDS